MKNKIYLALLIVLLLIFCTACKTRDDSGDKNDRASDYYQVHSLDSDLTFDDLVDYLTDKLGVEYYDPFETGSYKYEEHDAQLFSDYSLLLEKRLQDEIKYNDPGIVEAYEYHVNRMYVGDVSCTTELIVYEFDSSIIAHMYYLTRTQSGESDDRNEVHKYDIFRDLHHGTFFMYHKGWLFCARYLIGNLYVSFSVNVSAGGADPYMEFLKIADDLDLPVSDEISEAILNAE